MSEIKVTSLLKTILQESGINPDELKYDPKQKCLATPIKPEIFYKWEAQLTQCSYLCRLVYEPCELFLRGSVFLNYSPDVCNDVVTALTSVNYGKKDWLELFGDNKQIEEGIQSGKFFARCGCAVLNHRRSDSKIYSGNTTYVVFKGTSSIAEIKRDISVRSQELADIPVLKDNQIVEEGGVVIGFYNHLAADLTEIVELVNKLSVNTDRIVVTGHSLGGAMASIFSLVYGLLQKHKSETYNPKQLHCITMGAPGVVTDKSRNVFNNLLLNGKMTYDRVTTGGDPINKLPGARFSHPGFNILHTEMFPTKKTGRAYEIEDIRRIFLGNAHYDQIKKWAKQYSVSENKLPMDPAFWNLFKHYEEKEFTIEDIVQIQNNYGAGKFGVSVKNLSKKRRYTELSFVKFALGEDVDAKYVPTVEEAAEKEEAEEKAGKAAEKEADKIKPEEPEEQVGGFSLSKNKDAAKYKELAVKQYPNRVNYSCYKGLSQFCHAGYIGIGYMSVFRLPPMARVYDEKLGKRVSKVYSKKEPLYNYNFVYNPTTKNIESIQSTQVRKVDKTTTGGRKHKTKRVVKNKRLTRKSTKHSKRRTLRKNKHVKRHRTTRKLKY